jgi:hypothetical protein
MSKKNNTAQKSALEIEQLSKALREGTEKTLRNLLKEAIEDIVDNDEESQDAEPIEDDSYEVQDVETDETPSDAPEEGEPETSGEGEEASSDDEGGADEWGDYDEFKVGDNEYDFTGVDGDLALKIYQALSDDDQISVKKDDEGNIKVSDGETGAGVVIELTPEDGGAENGEEGISDKLPGDEGAEGDADGDIDIQLEPDAEGGADDEIEIDLGDGLDDEPSDDELNEDLGYTDSYQKDVMPGLKMNEPADKKATYSMDDGAPEGNKKPWAGKHTEKDYKETHTDLAEGCEGGACEKELEEGAMSTSSQSVAKETHTPTSEPRANNARQVAKLVHNGGKQLDEAKALKILEAAKAIQAENKQIKALAGKLRKSLMEAATLNMNYGKIVTLLVNESTTKAEKQSIIERFNKVTTVKEGAILFESIKRELNESHKSDAANVLNEQISAESSRQINETTFYQTSANNKSISLMERMDNLGRNYSKGGYKPINENTSKGLDLMNRISGLQTKRQV